MIVGMGYGYGRALGAQGYGYSYASEPLIPGLFVSGYWMTLKRRRRL